MDEFEQSDLEKETIANDSHNTCYQNSIHYKEKKMHAFIKIVNVVYFLFVFVIKLGRSMTEIFSVGLQKTNKDLRAFN